VRGIVDCAIQLALTICRPFIAPVEQKLAELQEVARAYAIAAGHVGRICRRRP